MSKTADRIRARWNSALPQNNVLSGGDLDSTGLSVYSGSSVTNTTSDFLGDWRAADSWQRFDIWRVRNRSRQLERGNEWCQSFKRSLLNNVLGAKGFHVKPLVVTSNLFGDTTNGEPDERASLEISAALAQFGEAPNFTTRKKLTRRDVDRLLLSRLVFDGEVIIRKIKPFDNDFRFTWQIIDPDYLDQNLNRIEPNGNITKMGVELDATYKFPVAYWFLHRRPNDYFYNYTDLNQQRYIRVPAEEVYHIFVQTEDSEQTRGWPWIFSAVVNLFRMKKFEEAALVNATIGASKGVYYKKEYPEGWVEAGRELDGSGNMIDQVEPGMAQELPYGVTPVTVDMRYPDGEFENFRNAMMLGAAAAFGTSYATTTGDLSKANFVSSRMGQLEEREFYMATQEFLIEKWKRPSYEEEVYRAILARKINLPLSKFDKFKNAKFTGRRWPFVQPMDDLQAKTLALDNCLTSISDIIEETTGETGEEMFKRIAADEKLMGKYGLKRVHSTFQFVSDTDNPDPNNPKKEPKDKPKEQAS